MRGTSGTQVRLKGKLSAGSRACVKKKRVKLVKLEGKKKRLLQRGRTNRDGRYSFDRAVRKTTGT